MRRIETVDHGTVGIVRLNNGVTNAINPELLEDLSEAILMIRRDYRGMILAGGGKFFSIGLDLPTLMHFNRTDLSDFLHKLDEVVLNLLTLPLPTCCVLSGHAVAGGCVLALTGDFRYAEVGKKFIGLNEVKLGLPVPYLADAVLRQIVGDRAATEMLYCGEYMTTSEATGIGLVDALLSPEDLEERAIEKVAHIANLPQAAFSAIKSNRVETIRLRYEANHELKKKLFLDCWFTEQVQALLEEASRRFSKS
jgi:enoyl-CoA hydratase/carnithine racemase